MHPVIVGIDGSKDALRAAMWAADEAAKRGTFVRLVHVITDHPRNRDRGFAHAGQILYEASAAIHSARASMLVDSDVFEGDLVAELVEASREAALICIGSTDAESSVAELRRRASAPVMVIGRGRARRFGHRRHIESATIDPGVRTTAFS
jgi:nucleotide-binding universal stress UspA family protein